VAHFQISGVHHTERIEQSFIQSSPQWDPTKPLPISLAEAERVARHELHKLAPDEKSWQVDYFRIKRSVAKAAPNWYFHVVFHGPYYSETNLNNATVFVDFVGRTGVFDARQEMMGGNRSEPAKPNLGPARDPYEKTIKHADVAHFQIDGVHHTATIDNRLFSPSTQWDPTKPLPVSLAEVERVARHELHKLGQNERFWHVGFFSIGWAGATPNHNWYFHVHFMGPNNSETNFNTAAVFVDFNGKPGVFDAPNEYTE